MCIRSTTYRQSYWTALLDSLIEQTYYTDLILDSLIGQPYWTDLLDSLMNSLIGQPYRTALLVTPKIDGRYESYRVSHSEMRGSEWL